MSLKEKTINYIANFLKIPVRNFVLSALGFSSPIEGQLRYDPVAKTLAWYNGITERNLNSLTITELVSVKNYVDGLVGGGSNFKSYSESITCDGILFEWTLTHNLGTLNYIVFAVNQLSENHEAISWGRNSLDPTNKVDISIYPAPLNGYIYDIIVMGF